MEARKTRKLFAGKLPAIFIFSVLILITGTPSFAQEVENMSNTQPDEFSKWDADADQLWNREEFEFFITDIGLHGDWDVNYDGVYDDDELYTGFLNDWDTNEDGRISREEYATGSTEWEQEYRDSFEEWNANNDNYLDIEEYATAMNQTGVFAGWDADEDGVYSENEVNEGLFNAYDTNDDGFLNQEEFANIENKE